MLSPSESLTLKLPGLPYPHVSSPHLHFSTIDQLEAANFASNCAGNSNESSNDSSYTMRERGLAGNAQCETILGKAHESSVADVPPKFGQEGQAKHHGPAVS